MQNLIDKWSPIIDNASTPLPPGWYKMQAHNTGDWSKIGEPFWKFHRGSTMDIWSPPGTYVKYLNKNGYESDRERANKVLEEGKQYTVYKIDVGSSRSTVQLVEFPDQWFNTVMFENLEGYDENNPYSKRKEKEWDKYYWDNAY